MTVPAAFLDRDGTLIEDVDYLTSVSQVRFLPGAAEAVRLLNAADVPAIVVTNQAGVARGFLSEETLLAIHEEILARLARAGAHLAAIYYCPHHPEAGAPPYRRVCDCRKPQPGLILRAARDLGLDVSRSMMVGDASRDVAAGLAAGCGAIYRVGSGAAEDLPLGARSADGLLSAVRHWLAGRGGAPAWTAGFNAS